MLLFSLSPTISYGTIYNTTGHFIDEGQAYPGTNGYAVSLWDLEEENVCKRNLMVIDNFVIRFIDRLLLLAAMIASFVVVDSQKCDLIDSCYLVPVPGTPPGTGIRLPIYKINLYC